jgi:hypothetical protein
MPTEIARIEKKNDHWQKSKKNQGPKMEKLAMNSEMGVWTVLLQ